MIKKILFTLLVIAIVVLVTRFRKARLQKKQFEPDAGANTDSVPAIQILAVSTLVVMLLGSAWLIFSN